MNNKWIKESAESIFSLYKNISCKYDSPQFSKSANEVTGIMDTLDI